MQAAEFMDCTDAQADILKYLQNILIEIIERTKKVAASQSSSLDSHAYNHHWHNMQVCACIALLS
jgi:hypothetical protein